MLWLQQADVQCRLGVAVPDSCLSPRSVPRPPRPVPRAGWAQSRMAEDVLQLGGEEGRCGEQLGSSSPAGNPPGCWLSPLLLPLLLSPAARATARAAGWVRGLGLADSSPARHGRHHPCSSTLPDAGPRPRSSQHKAFVGDDEEWGGRGSAEGSHGSGIRRRDSRLRPTSSCSLSFIKCFEGQNLYKYNTDTHGRSPRPCD